MFQVMELTQIILMILKLDCKKFGANLSINVVDINSSLAGVNKQLDRDHFVKNTRDPAFNNYYLRNN